MSFRGISGTPFGNLQLNYFGYNKRPLFLAYYDVRLMPFWGISGILFGNLINLSFCRQEKVSILDLCEVRSLLKGESPVLLLEICNQIILVTIKDLCSLLIMMFD